jgi:hypothetical protein
MNSEPLDITTTELSDATVGSQYSEALGVKGGTAPYSWEIESGALPAGLSLSGGKITGIPKTKITSKFTLKVTDSKNSVTAQELELAVKPTQDNKRPTGLLSKIVLKDDYARIVAQIMLYALLLGCVVAAIGAWNHWLTALLWAGASSAVGWVLGFLFGIPRVLTSAGVGGGQNDGSATTAAMGKRRSVGSNTNLEQISDWLTKIIVGVTLVQLGPAVRQLDAAAVLIGEGLGGGTNKSFAYALMLYFSIIGFLGAYLLARVYLKKAFESSEE